MPACTPELTPFVGDLLDRLAATQLDDTWQERSAVIEFDAGLPRPLAEAVALIEMLRRHPNLLAKVQVLAFERYGGTQWLLTDSLAHARRAVRDIGGVEVGCHPVTDVVRDQFAGIALLGAFG